MSNQARVSNGLLWVFIALYVLMGAARLLHNPHLQRLTPFISVAILMGFAMVHGIRRYGWKHFVVFFIVAFVISWSYETLSILTGFPFGHYDYTDDGHVWWTGDIHAASALVALFTMLFVTVLALVRVSRNPALH